MYDWLFFVKHKTAYEMRISDWSSDVCSSDLMPQIYSRASGLLVTLKRDEILSYTIPSKVQAYLAAGKPTIAALDGEGARIVEEAKEGYTSEAEENGSASCRERVCQYGYDSVVAVTLKKKRYTIQVDTQ